MDLPSPDLNSLTQDAGNALVVSRFLGTAVDGVNQAGAWMHENPGFSWCVASGAVLVGLILWLTGARILKPSLATLGTIFGGVCGMLLFPMLSAPGAPTPGNIDPAYIGMGCGGLLGLLATLLAFRTAIAVTLGVVCATLSIAATGGVLGVARFIEAHEDAARAYGSPRVWIVSHDRDVTSASVGGGFVRADRLVHADAKRSASPLGFTGPAARMESDVREHTEAVTQTWQTLSRTTKVTLLMSGLMGLLAGMILGLAATRPATALLTATLGSAAWMIGAAWLVSQVFPGIFERVGVQPIGWLTIWLTLAAAGMFLQRSRQRPAITPAPVSAAPSMRPL